MFRRQTKPKNEVTQVLVLHYRPKNNFQRFKEKMAAEALKEYGDLGLLIETERYYEPPEVQVSDYDLTPEGDPYGGNRILYHEALKSRAAEIRKMRNKRSSLYASIWQKIEC